MAKPTRGSSRPATKTETSAQDSAGGSGPVQPKIQFRDQMELVHHLFKGDVAKCLKADKWGPIKIKEIEHVHHFHTHNSNGTPQEFCHAVAGHVHRWEWSIDAQGNLVAECGPALKKVIKPGPNGINRVSYEPIRVKNPDTNDMIADNHRHKMVYKGSDRLSVQKIQAIQEANARKIGPPVGVTVNEDPKAPEGYSVVDTDRTGAQE